MDGGICVICCIVAACFILRYFVRWDEVSRFFGFESKYEDKDEYGFTEYCELDSFDD